MLLFLIILVSLPVLMFLMTFSTDSYWLPPTIAFMARWYLHSLKLKKGFPIVFLNVIWPGGGAKFEPKKNLKKPSLLEFA